jgi:ribosomal protein S26
MNYATGAKIGLTGAEKETAHPNFRVGRVYSKTRYCLRVAIDACADPE